mgnify:CR=1 FL=1
MELAVYEPGVEYAKKLIAEGKVSFVSGEWHLINPDTEQQDAFIEEHGIHAWGLWHLAYHPEGDLGAKDDYEFPYGNYKTVCREGLVAAESTAKQFHHEEIRAAAIELIRLADAALGLPTSDIPGAGY